LHIAAYGLRACGVVTFALDEDDVEWRAARLPIPQQLAPAAAHCAIGLLSPCSKASLDKQRLHQKPVGCLTWLDFVCRKPMDIF